MCYLQFWKSKTFFGYSSLQHLTHLIVQNAPDELLVALQAVRLCPVGLDKVVQTQVHLWAAVRNVGNDLRKSEPLLHPNSVLVGLIVAV